MSKRISRSKSHGTRKRALFILGIYVITCVCVFAPNKWNVLYSPRPLQLRAANCTVITRRSPHSFFPVQGIIAVPAGSATMSPEKFAWPAAGPFQAHDCLLRRLPVNNEMVCSFFFVQGKMPMLMDNVGTFLIYTDV